MKYNLIKVGSDAEIFLKDSLGVPVPVCGLVGGTKAEPLPVKELGEGFAVQEDNVMLEFNIPPASTAQDFSRDMLKMLAYLRGKMVAEKQLTLTASSCLYFRESQLQQIPQALQFGCEPDFDVWARAVNPIPEALFNFGTAAGEKFTSRCAGTHIHVSYDVDDRSPSLAEVEYFVKAMDLFIGLPAIMLPVSYESERTRRHMYGRAGAFRLKPYGHEYRVLGSGILAFDGAFEWIFNQTKKAADFLAEEGSLTLLQDWSSAIRSAINQASRREAKNYITQFDEFRPSLGLMNSLSWMPGLLKN